MKLNPGFWTWITKVIHLEKLTVRCLMYVLMSVLVKFGANQAWFHLSIVGEIVYVSTLTFKQRIDRDSNDLRFGPNLNHNFHS